MFHFAGYTVTKEAVMKEEKCPFLEVKTVMFCKAFPVKKMIPVERLSSTTGLCSTVRFEECSLFKEISLSDREVESVKGFSLKTNCYYHPRHLWVGLSGKEEREVTVGIDDFAQKIIGRIEMVSPSPEHTPIREGNVCCLLSTGPRKVRVIAPVSGVVKEVNTRLIQRPSLINDDPYCDGWIFKVDLAGDGIKGLFYGSSARNWLRWEGETLKKLLAAETGPTASNGGEVLDDISGQLTDRMWKRVVSMFLE